MLVHKKGSALILAIITGIVVMSFAGTAVYMSATDYRFSSEEAMRMKARYIAESGLSRGVKYMNASFANSPLSFAQIDTLGNKNLYSNEPFNAPYKGNTVKLGEYTVTVKVLTGSDMEVPAGKDITGNTNNSIRYISLVSTGFVPNSTNPKAKVTIKATYEMGTQVSHVFDYAYFINNWGWFYSNDITAYGNVRSNGSFSFSSYKPKIRSKPRFESSDGIDLIGYVDDNGDGKENNQDGGVYAWNTIDGSPNNNPKVDLYAGLKGTDLTPPVPQVPMPNINNLSMYEAAAVAQSSSVKINGVEICDGIWGDDEAQDNLYLEGTKQNPIVVDGTVVVHGDLIIRGWITGKGVFYVGRNIYIPQRVLYVNAPGENTPSTNSEAARESWRRRFDDCDLVGFFSKENIVLSNYTDSGWQSAVKSWVNNSTNESKEDSGADLIPGTGDAGENDNVFTIEKDPYGENIAGSGEDIDGDGKYDGHTQMSEFNVSTTFSSTSGTWGGNIPSGVTSFKQVCYWDESTDNPSTSTSKVTHFPQVDGILYTNHFIAGNIANSSYNYKNGNTGTTTGQDKTVAFNGSIISRNEAIIFSNGTNIMMTHDERLTAEDGSRFGITLPRVWKPLTLISMAIE